MEKFQVLNWGFSHASVFAAVRESEHGAWQTEEPSAIACLLLVCAIVLLLLLHLLLLLKHTLDGLEPLQGLLRGVLVCVVDKVSVVPVPSTVNLSVYFN